MGRKKCTTRFLAPLLCLCLAAGALSSPVFAHAQTGVAAIGGDTFSSWEEALANWDGGETLTLLADVQTETVGIAESKSLDLSGHVLRGSGEGSVLKIEGGATFSLADSSAQKSGAVTGGNAVYGGGIYVSGATLRLSARVSDNVSTNCGGGIYLSDGAHLDMEGGCVSGNQAAFGGGIFAQNASAVLSGIVENNVATINGGGLDLYDGASIESTADLKGNRAGLNGGAASVWQGGLLRVTGGTLSGNSAEGGGAVNVFGHEGVRGTAEISGGRIENNKAILGGGIRVGEYGTLRLSGGSVQNNAVTSRGGGVYLSEGGNAELSGSVSVTENSTNGAADNLYLEKVDLLSLETFSGKAGISMAAGGTVLSRYSGSLAGLSSDNELYELFTEKGALGLRSTVPVSLTVTKQPTKTSYQPGEAFRAEGMEVTATYDDGREEKVTDFEVVGGEKLETSTQIEVRLERHGRTISTFLGVSVAVPAPAPVQTEEAPILFVALILLAAALALALVTVCYAVDRLKKKRS